MAKWKGAKKKKKTGAEGHWENYCDTSLLHRLKLMVSDEPACGRRSAWGKHYIVTVFFCPLLTLLKAQYEWSVAKALYQHHCSDSQTDIISWRYHSRLSCSTVYMSSLPREQEAQSPWRNSSKQCCTTALWICKTINRLRRRLLNCCLKSTPLFSPIFFFYSSSCFLTTYSKKYTTEKLTFDNDYHYTSERKVVDPSNLTS